MTAPTPMFLSGLFLGATLLACGESHRVAGDAGTGPADAGRLADGGALDAGSGDGGPSDGGPASCPDNVFALEGMPCANPGLSCGGPCTDECSFCNLMTCTDGEWMRLEAHPAPCFSCGEDQCVAFDEYCMIAYADIAGEPHVYECRDLPEACRSDRTCGCLEAEGVFFNECSDAGKGELTAELFGG